MRGDDQLDQTRPKQNLRLWLKMLDTTNKVEKHIRLRLREEFQTTLPRFDVLAELYRRPNGITMGDLSSMLMVSNGNITGLAARLQKDGMIVKSPMPTDKRTHLLYITRKGKQLFEDMAKSHEKWICELFSNLQNGDVGDLLSILSKTNIPEEKAETKNDI